MKLTIYLLRSSVTDFDAVIPERFLQGEAPYVALEPRKDLPFPCQAYVQANKPKPPRWAPWLAPAFDLDELELQNQSNSFVLLLKVSRRIFAVTFGYGFNAVDRSLVEPDFGLKVTLNEVDPKELDTLDTRTIDRVTRQRRTHLNVGQSVDEFDIRVDIDWIRAVSGKPVSDALANKLAGSDSLKITWNAKIEKLGEHCKKLLEVYGLDTYRKHFEFIDYLRPLKPQDPLIPRLEAKLHALLKQRDDELVAVAYPEIPDDRIETWRMSYIRTAHECAELDIAQVYKFFDDHPRIPLDPDRINILGLDSDRAPLTQRASLHRYLVAQVIHEGSTYILSMGQWFRADTDYVKQVRRRVRALAAASATAATRLALPTWKRGKKEGEYNTAVGKAKRWLVLDCEPFKVNRKEAPIEVCDLLTPDRDFIHVKDMKSSATLSHLFGQGSISAELLKLAPDHAAEVKRRFEKHYRTTAYDKAPGPTVVYGVATSKPGDLADTMFFFSAVNLLQHADRLQLAGFDVALCRIEKET